MSDLHRAGVCSHWRMTANIYLWTCIIDALNDTTEEWLQTFTAFLFISACFFSFLLAWFSWFSHTCHTLRHEIVLTQWIAVRNRRGSQTKIFAGPKISWQNRSLLSSPISLSFLPFPFNILVFLLLFPLFLSLSLPPPFPSLLPLPPPSTSSIPLRFETRSTVSTVWRV